MSKSLTLNDCSKADLRWLVDRLLKLATTSENREYYLSHALDDLQFKKEMDCLHRRKKLSGLATEKRQEYSDIMTPYIGKPLSSIPLDVAERAREALRIAEEADAKWAKLTGDM